MQLDVHASGVDERELDELTAKLRRQLLELDVARVERRTSVEVPEGAKAFDVAVVGSLVLTAAQTASMLVPVINAIRGWLGGRADRTVEVEIAGDRIRIEGASSADQERLIAAWVARHTVDDQ
jgi:hypothetical protein